MTKKKKASKKKTLSKAESDRRLAKMAGYLQRLEEENAELKMQSRFGEYRSR